MPSYSKWHQNEWEQPQLTPAVPPPAFATQYHQILQKLDDIDPIAYGKSRNFLWGAVTYLSPYISRGVLSTRQVYEHMISRGYKLAPIEKFVSELAWRDYFQQVYRALGPQLFTDIKQAQPQVAHRQLPAALVQASTQIEAVDEAIRQLYHTGYMHNHMRMYVASIACNIGQAHWQKPAAWLYYHLLDADIASNTCSWQWVAGSFSSKKYFCNQENINKYTGSRQRQSYLDVEYSQLPPAQIPAPLLPTQNWAPVTHLPHTPPLQLKHNLPLLLYTHYNLDPLWHNQLEANRILILEPSHFKQYPVSSRLIDFVLQLSQNIVGLQVFTGELSELLAQWPVNPEAYGLKLISKEHPAFAHWPGLKEEREWLAPQVKGYLPSFFAYWKKLIKYL